jgi:transposase-like protein
MVTAFSRICVVLTPRSEALLRKSYTAAFKLEAVAYAKKNGNRATARHFSINEKMIRNWRKQEDELRRLGMKKLFI